MPIDPKILLRPERYFLMDKPPSDKLKEQIKIIFGTTAMEVGYTNGLYGLRNPFGLMDWIDANKDYLVFVKTSAVSGGTTEIVAKAGKPIVTIDDDDNLGFHNMGEVGSFHTFEQVLKVMPAIAR